MKTEQNPPPQPRHPKCISRTAGVVSFGQFTINRTTNIKEISEHKVKKFRFEEGGVKLSHTMECSRTDAPKPRRKSTHTHTHILCNWYDRARMHGYVQFNKYTHTHTQNVHLFPPQSSARDSTCVDTWALIVQ